MKTDNIVYIPCNFCSSRDSTIIGTFESEDLIQLNKNLQKKRQRPIGPQNWKLTVVQCRRCKLAYINPRLSSESLKRWYEGFYGNQFDGGNTEFANTVYSVVNEEQEKGRLLELHRFIKHGKLLDIGAGPGHFLKTAKAAGWEVHGQDLSREAGNIAKKKFGIKKITDATIEDLPFPDKYFDVITMYSTLEHTETPWQYIQTAFKKLKPGGFLVLSVPNIASVNYYLARLLKLPYPGFIFEHLYYFNPTILTKMLGNQWKIVEMTSFHHSRMLLPAIPLPAGEQLQKAENKYKRFLRELSETEHKWLLIRQRAYEFQMRVLRELLEYNRFVGKLKGGDVVCVCAQKI